MLVIRAQSARNARLVQQRTHQVTTYGLQNALQLQEGRDHIILEFCFFQNLKRLSKNAQAIFDLRSSIHTTLDFNWLYFFLFLFYAQSRTFPIIHAETLTNTHKRRRRVYSSDNHNFLPPDSTIIARLAAIFFFLSNRNRAYSLLLFEFILFEQMSRGKPSHPSSNL